MSPAFDHPPFGSIAFDSLDGLAALSLPAFDGEAAAQAQARQDQLTKPQGSLGRLEELAVFMAGWRGTSRPRIDRAQVLIFAGNHGVCAQGVSPFPPEVTGAMVANFAVGGAAINHLARISGADLKVVALDLDRPTADFTQGPAMSEAEALDAMNRGAAAVDLSADVLLLGEMGIGNSTAAAALCAGLFDPAGDWVGPGTGAAGAMLEIKRRVVAEAAARHKGVPPAHMIAALGGRELAAICGAVLAARAARIPVLLDGFICTAAAAPLFGANPDLLAHCLIGHASAEPGHAGLVKALGKRPILDLGMRLGEGSGAAVALGVLRCAVAMHDGMATFAEAGIA